MWGGVCVFLLVYTISATSYMLPAITTHEFMLERNGLGNPVHSVAVAVCEG